MRIKFTVSCLTLGAVAASVSWTVASADVVLIRGSFAESVPVTRSAPDGPTLLRGERLRPVPAVAPAPPPSARVVPARTVTAGRTLWSVDQATGALQACWPRGTGMVGEYRIYCTTSR